MSESPQRTFGGLVRPEHVVAHLDRLATEEPGLAGAALERAARIVEHIIPQYHETHDYMQDGWYWLESDTPDGPPRLLRGVWGIGGTRRVAWEAWTTAGWVPVTGRVAVCGGMPRPVK